ncbi:DUF3048 domain-containing protein [Cellulomonas alba]|uniref:DUF3048 domain-containing protein n=1 Tax=Cellulomonas alba TaxID=3053467 RepID=A0ABT7SE12_9CELL|nr:DUF3048 domain-containing protein [Cellulomonas alba]MDM7854406.1 DUF3048 domain-containing protein [Cellulomonas alba]
MDKRWIAAVAATGLLALAACSAGGTTPPPTGAPVTVGPSVAPTKAGAPTPDVPVTWPLTGVATSKVADRPVITVKIENTAMARPQTGLESADIVWEEIVDFGVPRLAAMFQSKTPKEVGPIRSVRPMDPAISAPTHGLLAFSGGQAGIVAQVQRSGEQLFSNDAGAPGMYRTHDRAAPHNVYGSPATWWKHADAAHSKPPQPQFLFARTAAQSAAVAGGTAATHLAFHLTPLSQPRWTWDAEHDKWLRSEGKVASYSRSGKRLAATNVVSIVANHPNTRFKAQGGAPVPTYDLVGSGTGMIATGGRTIPVTWKKTSLDAPMRLFLADGSPALLAPGNTWVELVPKGTSSVSVG